MKTKVLRDAHEAIVPGYFDAWCDATDNDRRDWSILRKPAKVLLELTPGRHRGVGPYKATAGFQSRKDGYWVVLNRGYYPIFAMTSDIDLPHMEEYAAHGYLYDGATPWGIRWSRQVEFLERVAASVMASGVPVVALWNSEELQAEYCDRVAADISAVS